MDLRDVIIDRLVEMILDYDNNRQFFTYRDIINLALLNDVPEGVEDHDKFYIYEKARKRKYLHRWKRF